MKTKENLTLQKARLGKEKGVAEAPKPRPKRPKRVFDESFRRQAVALLESTGQPLREIAQQLGCSYWNLHDWRERYGKKRGGRATLPEDLHGALAQLQKEIVSLRAENDVLKKAMGILATPKRSATR